MAKKRVAKKAAKTTKKVEKNVQEEEVVLAPSQQKALQLVDKSAKIRSGLEQAVVLAAAKAVRKFFREQNVELTPAQATDLTSILFGE